MGRLMKNTKYKQTLFGWICVGFVVLTYLIMAVIFRYGDTVSFTAWSVEFWDSLFDDGIMNYYKYTMLNPKAASNGTPQGSWLTFFPWILWNFPIFVLKKITGVNVTCTACLLWSKCLLALCLFILCVFEYKIIQRITDNDCKYAWWVVLLTVGSLEMMTSISYAGQDEIVYLCTFVISLYLYMASKKGQALLWAVISVTLCPIMIVPYIFVAIIYEDGLFRILGSALVCVLPSFVFSFMYRNDTIYLSLKDNVSLETFQIMMNTTIFSTAIGNVSVGGILLVVLACECYFVNKATDKDKKIISTLAAVFFCLCFLMATSFYRSCLYVPFFAMFVCLPTDNFPYRVASLMIIEFGRFYKWLSHEYNFNSHFLAAFVGNRVKRDGANGLFINPTSSFFDCSIYIIRALVFACTFFVFILYYKDKQIIIKRELPMRVMVFLYSFSGIVFAAWYLIYFLA